MHRKPFDLNEYAQNDSGKLEQLLDLVLRNIQELHPSMQFKHDEQRELFIMNAAQGLLAHPDEKTKTREFILSDPFIHDLLKLVKGATKASENNNEAVDEEKLVHKITELLKTDLFKKENITKEELKLQLTKHLKPEEIRKLDSALQKALEDKELQTLFQFKPVSPRPTPSRNNKKTDDEDEEVLDRLTENLYGLRGNIPVIVSCFLGNPMIAKQGPTYENDLTQIASKLVTSSNSFGDSLGLKSESIELLQSQGIEIKSISDNVVCELNRPSNLPGH